MRKITLLCSAGMSTSILVTKMREAAEAQGYDCAIEAYSLSMADEVIPSSDIVLLGPQVRFNLAGLKEKYPEAIIEVIDMLAYGSLDGKKIIATVQETLKD